MAKSFILSDESVNDRGYRVLTKGINLERFKKNPVMLWMHRRDDGWDFTQVLPIGKWENIRKEDGKLLADPVFDENDKFAQLIKSKVENDFIKGASIGINPVELSDDPKLLEKGQTRATITKCEIYEASIVDMPSNKNTVRLMSAQENTEVPLLKNTAMAEESKDKQLTFKSESDLRAWVKEKYGIEPKAEETQEVPKVEEFKFKNETSFMSWIKETFGLQPKAKKPENENEHASEDVESLKAALKKEQDEKEELQTQVENLKGGAGASTGKVTKETDNTEFSAGEFEQALTSDDIEMYNALKS